MWRPLLLAALLVARPAAGAPCDEAGFPGAVCEVARARMVSLCVPRRLEVSIDRKLGRIQRMLAAGNRFINAGEDMQATYQLTRATLKLGALRDRVARFRSPMGPKPACRAAVDAFLAGLSARLVAIGDGPMGLTTTTVVPPSTATSATSSTSSTTTTSTTTTTSVPACGNGRLDRFEQCDGTNLFGRTCLTLGFHGGTLGCRPDCIFDVRACRR
jgi:hypothetical protein